MASASNADLRSHTKRAGSSKHLRDALPGRRACFERAKSESRLFCGADLKPRSKLTALERQNSFCMRSKSRLPREEGMLPSNLFAQTLQSMGGIKEEEENNRGMSNRKQDLLTRANSERNIKCDADLAPMRQIKAKRRHLCQQSSKTSPVACDVSQNDSLVMPVCSSSNVSNPSRRKPFDLICLVSVQWLTIGSQPSGLLPAELAGAHFFLWPFTCQKLLANSAPSFLSGHFLFLWGFIALSRHMAAQLAICRENFHQVQCFETHVNE